MLEAVEPSPLPLVIIFLLELSQFLFIFMSIWIMNFDQVGYELQQNS